MSDGFKSVFREYDIRGRVNESELNDASVRLIAGAYARFLIKRGIGRAVVGYDNRTYSEGFAKAAIDMLAAWGIDAVYIGLCLTPTVYYAQYIYECEGAVMITASHNPNGWCGLKLGSGYSRTLEPEEIKEVYGYAAAPTEPSSGKKGTVTERPGTRSSYIDEIVSRIQMGPYKPRLVLDAGNGGAGLFAYEIFQRLGCVTFQLNCDPDTSYPHYFPNPSDLSTRVKLREMVTHQYIKADIGLSFDGDGDRLGVVDENGADIWSDLILAALAEQLLQKGPGQKIVYDVKCSQAIEDVVRRGGGVPVMWKTGHSYIKAKMRECGAALAGERSGHIFFGGDEYYGFDDAMFAAAKLVEYLSHKKKSVSALLKEFPQYVTSPELKAHCPDNEKYAVTEQLVSVFKEKYPGKVNDVNGARVSFPHGWGLVRASSNMPELVLVFEADTAEHMREIASVFAEETAKHASVEKGWEKGLIIAARR